MSVLFFHISSVLATNFSLLPAYTEGTGGEKNEADFDGCFTIDPVLFHVHLRPDSG